MIKRTFLALHSLNRLGLVFDDCQNHPERHKQFGSIPKFRRDVRVRRDVIQQHPDWKYGTPTEKSSRSRKNAGRSAPIVAAQKNPRQGKTEPQQDGQTFIKGAMQCRPDSPNCCRRTHQRKRKSKP